MELLNALTLHCVGIGVGNRQGLHHMGGSSGLSTLLASALRVTVRTKPQADSRTRPPQDSTPFPPSQPTLALSAPSCPS